jgi:hypothetical protein
MSTALVVVVVQILIGLGLVLPHVRERARHMARERELEEHGAHIADEHRETAQRSPTGARGTRARSHTRKS